MKMIMFVLIVISIGCNNNRHQQKIQIHGFNEQKWKEDSLGCSGVRLKLCYILKDSISVLIGHTKSELKDLLGNPNYEDQKQNFLLVSYFVRNGRQCFDTSWKRKGYIDAEQINFMINPEGNVTGTTGVIYP